MSDTDRVIGALTEFKKATEKRLDKIERKVDALNYFKWRVGVSASVVSGFVVAAFKILEVIGKH